MKDLSDNAADDADGTRVRPRRRVLLAGTGALVGAALASTRSAEAAPQTSVLRNPQSGISPMASPVASTIASAPVNNTIYRHFEYFDFTPESPTSQRTFGTSGVYTANTASTLWTSCDIPFGAKLRDIEWYVRNASSSAITTYGRLWTASEGYLDHVVGDVTIPTGSTIAATRLAIPSGSNGPFPLGTKLALGITTGTDGTIQVNGVRVGLFNGGGQIGLQASPVSVYDSTASGGTFAAGETRSVTLASSQIPPGVSGVILTVNVINAAGAGYLKLYSGATVPSAASLSYPSTSVVPLIAGSVTVGISTKRQITIYSSQAARITIDLVGTIS